MEIRVYTAPFIPGVLPGNFSWASQHEDTDTTIRSMRVKIMAGYGCSGLAGWLVP